MTSSRRKSHWADNFVLAPWWVSFTLAVIVFAIAPLVVPSPLRGVVMPIAFFFLCLSALSVFRSLKSAWVLDRQNSLDSILNLSSKEFENLLGEAYRRHGYKVEETLTTAADGGVDLVLRRKSDVILVQCKRFREKPVPVQTIRELYGVLHDRHATGAKLVTTSTFTPDAKAFAARKPIELIGKHELLRLIKEVQTRSAIITVPTESSAAVLCPICKSEMVRRTAKRGPNPGSQFWGCPNYPKCHGTRPVASDE